MATAADLSGNQAAENIPDDPFVSSHPTGPSPHRYASFDNQLFSLHNSASPAQAKRALEAHLKDTERRIHDASKLGTTLLQQRKDLAARLKEVEEHSSEEIGPELQKKLDQLEKDYSEIGKESARAFLPKSRIVSTDFSDVTRSPAVFASEARPSPSKPGGAVSRRQRNQPTNRVHDIEFATEISTSLLAQVRQLQAVLAEKENVLKDTTHQKAQLESEMDVLMQRLRALDESEQKCKDENWNLETQLQDMTAALKDAAHKDQRLNHQLKVAQSEKDQAERELEDLKAAHGKLTEDHESAKKHHEADMFGLRRDVSSHESARDALLKKVDELTAQNTQLAKAVAARWNSDQEASSRDRALVNEHAANDVETPEVSPQNSPMKPTPRHGMLETETLKSSLTHAHRMIQNLKNNIHREKTEKFELKRLLQDARDELDSKRNDAGAGAIGLVKKRRSEDNGIKFKKPFRPDKLGATRATQREIILDDEDWEDQSFESPSRITPRNVSIGTVPFDHAAFSAADNTDAFETANERDTTDAFETADERDNNATETEDAFQTGAETLDGGSSEELTETESSVQKAHRPVSQRASRPPPFQTSKAENRLSFMSTASTSADELEDVKTPDQSQQPRYKIRVSRGRNSASARNSSAFVSDLADSPASQTSSNQHTPRQTGQSLSAELDGLSDESDSGSETPAHAGIESAPTSPGTAHNALSEAIGLGLVTKPQMVDSAMMTEPWEPESKSVVGAAAGAVGTAIAGVAGFALGHSSVEEKDAAPTADAPKSMPTTESAMPGQFIESEPAPTMNTQQHFAAVEAEPTAPATPKIEKKNFTGVVSQSLEPVSPLRAAPKEPETLSVATFSSTHTEPIVPEQTVKEPEKLSLSTFSTSHTEPITVAPIVKEPEKFSVSQYPSAHTEPVFIAPTVKEPEKLSISQYSNAHTEPVAIPQDTKTPQALSMATFSAAHTEPIAPVEHAREVERFAVSPLKSTDMEPLYPVTPGFAESPVLGFSSFIRTHTEPTTPVIPQEEESPFDSRKYAFSFSPVQWQQLEPVEEESLQFPQRRSSKRSDIALLSSENEATEGTENSIPGTDAARPGLALFGSSDVVYPPRTSSRDGPNLRPTSPHEPRLFGGAKGANLNEPTLVFADENVPTPQLELDNQFRQPFAEMSNNVGSSNRSVASEEQRPSMKRSKTSEMGTQTAVSAGEIDKMLKFKPPVQIPALSIDESSPVKSQGSPRRSSETPATSDSSSSVKGPRRPSSVGSIRKQFASPPPLPTDHHQRIAAASGKNLSPPMGPPNMPASAYNSFNKPPPSLRSRTPSITKSSGRGAMTRPLAPIPAGQEAMSPVTRASSISSFASELDERFHIHRNGVLYPEDLAPATDPRMIQAITQTMIGEYLWKYTRKAGRSEISSTRHRRFFWVHPYTRTLYWSEHDPSTMGKQQMKAKSVAIEAVRIINDDNAYPPGLHRKSLVIVTPGREIVFTAPTAQRHETWFNALSYLLLRTGVERGDRDTNDDLTNEEVDEFNPQLRSTSRNTVRTRMSLSSYNSRTTRNSSPQRQHASEVPSLAQRQSAATMSQRRGGAAPGSSDGNVNGRPSIMSGFFKSPSNMRGSFSSRRSKSAMSTRRPLEPTIYDASVIEDSSEDLRQIIEGQEIQADRLENVRSCCDGKHDVGSLSRMTGRQAAGTLRQSHSHPIAEPLTVSSRPRRGE